MRTKAELQAREAELCQDLWYVRHVNAGLPDGTPADIVAQAGLAAERIRRSRDPEYLAAITDLEDGYSVGRLHGELATVRWALGWAGDDGLLDT